MNKRKDNKNSVYRINEFIKIEEKKNEWEETQLEYNIKNYETSKNLIENLMKNQVNKIDKESRKKQIKLENNRLLNEYEILKNGNMNKIEAIKKMKRLCDNIKMEIKENKSDDFINLYFKIHYNYYSFLYNSKNSKNRFMILEFLEFDLNYLINVLFIHNGFF
jgi:uncharacterized ubiquitin-like protein YukD